MTATPKIWLKDIWPISNPRDYKVHFATWNRSENPLDCWVRDPTEWRDWQAFRPTRNEFSRPLIFSLMDFYPEKDVWLFGGVFRVLARHANRYEVEQTPDGELFVGRLKLRSDYRKRLRRVNFENHYESLEVAEVLSEPYSGRRFPGYGNIDVSFAELETHVRSDRPDWKSALSVNGVYLITDTKTGRRYVGSAYGDEGIWGRWSNYAGSGHGGNKELRMVVGSDLSYPRTNFRFTLLEFFPFGTPDQAVIGRESHWKEVLLTRDKRFGLNSN